MTVTAGARPRVGMHIGGEEVSAVGGRWFDSIDPFTGQAWAEVAAMPATSNGPSRPRTPPSWTAHGPR